MRHTTFNERVGKNLRDLRLEHDLSMRELADRLGTTNTKICRIENGSAKLSLEDATRIADLFDVSLDKLIEQLRGGKMMECKNCITQCSGAGREGIATTCSYYQPGPRRKVKILEITCCGECPYYNPDRDHCTKGAEIPAEDFFADCPLEE